VRIDSKVPPLLGTLLMLALARRVAAAQVPSPPDSATVDPERQNSRWSPPRLEGAGGVIYLPKLYYSTDNSFGAGGQILRPFRLPGCGDRALDSEISLKARVTIDGYLRAEIRTTLYPRGADWMFRAKISHDNLSRRFWGVGTDTPSEDEENFRPQDTLAYVEFFRTLVPRLRIGVRGEYEHFKYDDVEAGGLLETTDYPGKGVDGISGVGLLAEWDSRDDQHDPHRGLYLQAFSLAFGEKTGSDFSFNNYNVDLRGYLPISEGQVLALQYFLYSALGDAPIWRYAELGGRPHSRGYRTGRYVDRLLMAFQAEYRRPLSWRLGLSAFAGLANVTEEYHHFELEHMRPTIGGGLLLRTGRQSNVVIRSELAAGENSLRAHLSIGHAF